MSLLRSVLAGCVCSIVVLFFLLTSSAYSQGTGGADVYLKAVVAGCGNQLIESGEECDGNALSGATCHSKGFTSGILSCTTSCFFDVTSCVYTPPTSSGGGGNSRGRGIQNSAQIVLTGKAYPQSEVTVLKDAVVVATTIADDNANFQVAVRGLAAGTYIFSMYSEDDTGVRSALFTFPVTVTRGILAKIGSIFVSPTVTSDKTEVKQGDLIVFFGQSYPNSEVTIEVNSAQKFFVKSPVSADGVFLHRFDSSPLELGGHHVRARSTDDEQISTQSAAYAFTVGTENIYTTTTVSSCPKKADMNSDCKVNLVDFSIVAFWYKREISQTFRLREKEHLNGDGLVNLVDFSILAFYWTG